MFKWLYKPKLNELLEMYLAAHRLRLSPSTVRLTKQAWKQMVALSGNIRVNGFRQTEAENIQALWLSQANSTTARIYRKSVSPVFSWSILKKYIKTHPFRNIKTPKEAKKQVRVYTDKEFARLVRACEGDIRWITTLLIARSTGLRKSAIQNLTRDEICFETETINLKEKADTESTWPWRIKDREERTLPLATAVACLLTELLYSTPASQPYILIKPARYFHLLEMKKLGQITDAMRMCPVSNFDRKFRKIKKRANVKGRFHDLRATCLTDLSSVLNLNELLYVGGHSDVETSMRYIGTGRDAVNKARQRVNESLAAVMTPSHALYPN